MVQESKESFPKTIYSV